MGISRVAFIALKVSRGDGGVVTGRGGEEGGNIAEVEVAGRKGRASMAAAGEPFAALSAPL